MQELKELFSFLSPYISSVITLGILLWTISYGQGKAKERQEAVKKDIQEIKEQLTNHIPTALSEIKDRQIKCREEMGDRVSTIEGELNNRK